MSNDRHINLVVTSDMLDPKEVNALIWERLFGRCAHTLKSTNGVFGHECTKCGEPCNGIAYAHYSSAQIPLAPNFINESQHSLHLYDKLSSDPFHAVVGLANIRNGRRGRFLVLGYTRRPVDSFHHTLVLEDATGLGHPALIAYAAVFLINSRPWPLVTEAEDVIIDVAFTTENLQ